MPVIMEKGVNESQPYGFRGRAFLNKPPPFHWVSNLWVPDKAAGWANWVAVVPLPVPPLIEP